MSEYDWLEMPDRELFEDGVYLTIKYNKDIRTNLFGILRLSDGKIILPCLYKKILSYRNGVARVINMAGIFDYINDEGDSLHDPELPFVRELCSDFDETGFANIACLVDGCSIFKGHMSKDGTMNINECMVL